MIDDFFEAIEDIEDKNYGGCLFFCLVFWLWLKANSLPTESFQIVQYDLAGLRIPINQEWIKGNQKHATSSLHFTWLYKGKEYDADGLFFPSIFMFNYHKEVLLGLNTKNGELVEEFCENALNHSSWNSRFDRMEAIEFILSSEELGFDLYHLS